MCIYIYMLYAYKHIYTIYMCIYVICTHTYIVYTYYIYKHIHTMCVYMFV